MRLHTWGPQGRMPVQHVHFNRNPLSPIAALMREHCLFGVNHCCTKRKEVICLLRGLTAHLKGQRLVIWQGFQNYQSWLARDCLGPVTGSTPIAFLACHVPDLDRFGCL